MFLLKLDNKNKLFYGLQEASPKKRYGNCKSSFRYSFRFLIFSDFCKLCLTENTSLYMLLKIRDYSIKNPSLLINVDIRACYYSVMLVNGLKIFIKKINIQFKIC